MAFNLKINKNGEYREFCGWTVIMAAEHDLKFVENYISKNRLLQNFFSALPASSYHITLYNVWCNRSPLLSVQEEEIKKAGSGDMREILMEESRSIGFFNPDGCMIPLLRQLEDSCVSKEGRRGVTVTVKRVFFNGNAIRISVNKSSETDQMSRVRKEMTQICGRKDGMGSFHMTLGYKFKDLTEEEKKNVDSEIAILNMLLDRQTIRLRGPRVCKFRDMTKFTPVFET